MYPLIQSGNELRQTLIAPPLGLLQQALAFLELEAREEETPFAESEAVEAQSGVRIGPTGATKAPNGRPIAPSLPEGAWRIDRPDLAETASVSEKGETTDNAAAPRDADEEETVGGAGAATASHRPLISDKPSSAVRRLRGAVRDAAKTAETPSPRSPTTVAQEAQPLAANDSPEKSGADGVETSLPNGENGAARLPSAAIAPQKETTRDLSATPVVRDQGAMQRSADGEAVAAPQSPGVQNAVMRPSSAAIAPKKKATRDLSATPVVRDQGAMQRSADGEAVAAPRSPGVQNAVMRPSSAAIAPKKKATRDLSATPVVRDQSAMQRSAGGEAVALPGIQNAVMRSPSAAIALQKPAIRDLSKAHAATDEAAIQHGAKQSAVDALAPERATEFEQRPELQRGLSRATGRQTDRPHSPASSSIAAEEALNLPSVAAGNARSAADDRSARPDTARRDPLTPNQSSVKAQFLSLDGAPDSRQQALSDENREIFRSREMKWEQSALATSERPPLSEPSSKQLRGIAVQRRPAEIALSDDRWENPASGQAILFAGQSDNSSPLARASSRQMERTTPASIAPLWESLSAHSGTDEWACELTADAPQAPSDPDWFERQLTATLRRAARQHGLEV